MNGIIGLAAVVVLASAIAVSALPPPQAAPATSMTDAEYANAMKELQSLDKSLRSNIEEIARADLERMLLFETTMNARAEAAKIEEILGGVLIFWEARKSKDGIAFSREALMEAANISKALSIIDLHSPSIATLAQERLGKICANCHAAHRERLPNGTFRIK
jgi:hypothetical protein